ncbi:MAG: transporter substrate-binding domain-containing protein [Desulfosalsimonas sp.]|uniref:transporter substrate-binding domain-containing protein n=1 Tax=Desulfosalsimonas sp. TaxID=3073848 RepID=UPI0039705377
MLILSAVFLFIHPVFCRAQTPVLSASEIDYPPFCFVDEQGRADGFSVELMRAALSAMDRDVVFRTGAWQQVRGWLEDGEVAALPLVGRTPEREEIFDFTFPYMSLHGAIVVRRGTTGIWKLSDLEGRQVAVMKGDNAEEFLRRKDRGIDIRTTTTFEEALYGLSEGQYDAVFIQRLVALRLLQETGLTNLEIVNKPVEEFRQDFCFAVKEGDRNTLALLNEGLALLMADGTYRRLHAKWFAAMQLPGRQLLVGGDHNYPPYEFLDENGRPAGFNVDLLRAVAREVGLDIHIQLGPWEDIRRALKADEIDVIQGMFYSPERDRVFDFTPPHKVNHYVAVVRKNQGPAPVSVDELEGMRIVVQGGDIMHDFVLENGLKDRVSVVDAQEDALRQLAQGRHDCTLVARRTALYWMEKYGWDNLEVGRHAFLSPEYCMAVQNGHQALLAELGEGLEAVEESGEYRRIYEKWMGVYPGEEPGLVQILQYSAMVLGPLVFVLLASVAWSWSLRRQVARRTAEIQESEQHFRNLADSGSALIWTADTDKKCDYFNRAWQEFTGRSLSQEKGEGWVQGVHPEDRDRCIEIFRRAFDRHERFSMIYRLRRYDGQYRWIQDDGSPRYDFNGQFIGYIGHCLDITGFKRAQERIEHLNNVLHAIRDVNQLIVRERDPEALIREACRLLVDNRGYSSVVIVLTEERGRPVSWAEAGKGEDFYPLQEKLSQGELPECCRQAGAAGRVVMIEEQDKICVQCPIVDQCVERDVMCVQLVHADRVFGYLAVALSHGFGQDSEEQGLFAEMADDLAYALAVLEMDQQRRISEQQRQSLEEQLQQAQKMESVGRLAGGVAHDYNNMLSVIIGYAELALDKVDTADPLHADLTEILNAAKRSNDITRQLLAFARKQTINPASLDLNETVEGMLKMLHRLIGEDIDLSWVPGPGLWPVKMDPTQIDQILANLCVNARDAIAGVGHITIETHNISIDEHYCRDHAGFLPGEYVLLAVSDDGTGMDRQMLENIFEPFFTTKEVSKGTGLGLATVYGIVKQNNGFINVYSELQEGTTFRIYLPRHADEAKTLVMDGSGEVPRGSGQTVLLVEDEPGIMKMGQIMLQRLGYEVLVADSPAGALAQARDHGGPIHLLITDVVMPEMNGRRLAEAVESMCPEIKVLYMSGYTADVIANHGVLDKGLHFIEKPFSIRELAVKIEHVL